LNWGQERHISCHVGPLGGLGPELAGAGGGERVKAGATIVLRLAPRAFDPTPALQAINRGVVRPLENFEAVAGDLLDPQQNTVAMQGTERVRLENEQLKCALREFNRLRKELSPFASRGAGKRESWLAASRSNPGLTPADRAI